MTCDVSVIVSNLPVTQELIQNQQNGSLVRASNLSVLNKAIRVLVEEQEIRLRLVKNAKKHCRKLYLAAKESRTQSLVPKNCIKSKQVIKIKFYFCIMGSTACEVFLFILFLRL
jgi:hypothetical protein